MAPLSKIDKLLRWRQPRHLSSPAHAVASAYWANCSNTFLADADYYEKCEAVLRDTLLPKVGAVDRALDLGCGNGRFTLLLARTAKSVEARDLSADLIQQARRSACEHGVKNIRFKVEDIISKKPRPSSYGLVSCMGVLSTIIDDWAFRHVTQGLRLALRSEGWLLLRETLSSLEQGEVVESDRYAIRYRNENAYRKEFADLGLSLEDEIPLIRAGTCENRFYLYRVAGKR